MTSKADSFESYLAFMKDNTSLQLDESTSGLVRKFHEEYSFPSRFAPVVYMVDYTNGSYLYVDEACINLFGYSASKIKSGGLDSVMQSWHPADYKTINEKVFPRNRQFLQTLPAEKYPEIVFSYNYRMLNALGEYVTIVQRSSYLPSDKPGHPLGAIGVVFDVTHFKNDISVVQTIEEAMIVDGKVVYDLLFKAVYAVEDAIDLLSTREQEILKLMAQGMPSKLIAHQLNLSVYTINNHRKNMLAKTRCRTPGELINYANRHGYL